MSKRSAFFVWTMGGLLALVLSTSAFAQAGMSEVRGKITDADGNPLAGVAITFTSTVRDSASYTTKTNKKGRYFLDGLVYYNEGRWKVTVAHESLVPVWVRIESRTQTALVDKFDKNLKPGQNVPLLNLRAFGSGVVDVKLGTAAAAVQVVESGSGDVPVASGGAAPVPKDPWAQATVLVSQGKLEESLPLFEKAVSREPENVERRVAYAKVLYQRRNLGEATRQAAKATELDPASLEAHMVLYSIHVAGQNLAAASASLDEALEVAPQDLRVLKQVAFLADQGGDSEKAMDAHRRIVEAEPTSVESWLALGGLYADAGKTDESKAAYEKVVELDPANAHTAFFNLGALLMNKGSLSAADSKRAVEAFSRAVEIKPDYAAAWQQRAFALLGTGDTKGAATSLAKYLEHAPDAPDADGMQALMQDLRK